MRPDEAEHGRGGFAGAVKIVSPEKLFERLDESPSDRVDERAFLTARMVDVLVGDRDRHRDNWRWALMDADAPVRRWLPISRDHDEAFVKHDGVALRAAALYQPQLVSFGPGYDRTLNLNWHAREVDRRFLATLEWPVWDSTAAWLQARLSDEVIDEAVRTLPAAAYEADGPALAEALRRRRDGLAEEMRRYYRLPGRERWSCAGTDADEDVTLVRVDGRWVDVSISERGAEGPYVRRRFDARETREIRLRLWGGRDRVRVLGDGDAPIRIRVVGGSGRDDVARLHARGQASTSTIRASIPSPRWGLGLDAGPAALRRVGGLGPGPVSSARVGLGHPSVPLGRGRPGFRGAGGGRLHAHPLRLSACAVCLAHHRDGCRGDR